MDAADGSSDVSCDSFMADRTLFGGPSDIHGAVAARLAEVEPELAEAATGDKKFDKCVYSPTSPAADTPRARSPNAAETPRGADSPHFF